jgi:hypothetical protein
MEARRSCALEDKGLCGEVFCRGVLGAGVLCDLAGRSRPSTDSILVDWPFEYLFV